MSAKFPRGGSRTFFSSKSTQHAELIFAGALRDKDPEVHCTYILLWVGEKGREIYLQKTSIL